MGKRTLISERTGILTGSDTVANSIQSALIAPIAEGRVGSQGAYDNALIVDDAVIVWQVRPAATLFRCQARLRVTHYAIDGGWEGNFITVYAEPWKDVSGQLMLNRGEIEYYAKYSGVIGVELEITSWNAVAAAALVWKETIFGEPRERDGLERCEL